MEPGKSDHCAFPLRPLAAALALAVASASLRATTSLRPGEITDASVVVREDGTPLRTALRAWHLDALQNAEPPSPHATRRYVTNCADDGEGSLRAVVAASASGDTIDLSELTCSVITLETGGIAVRLDSATLVGPASRPLAIDGNHASRVFLHYGSGGFLLRNLTVRNGHHRATGFNLGIGGCIASAGYLTLDQSTVTGCYAGGEGAYGGAIYAYSLILSRSTLSNNVAYGVHADAGMAAFGGAAFVYQIDMVESTVTGNAARHVRNLPRRSYDIGGGISTVRGGLVINSTIDSNYSYGRGGGLATFSDILVRNSTISGNSARTIGGGGLFMRFPAALDARNSTITANTGQRGAGVLFTSMTALLQSTIVAGNVASVPGTDDLSSLRTTRIEGGNNLIGTTGAEITIPPDSRRGDPALAPLAANGGPTRTHALRAGSPAIDAGNNASQLASDQRGTGFARVVGTAADIGAFELGAGATDGASPAAVPASTRGFGALLLMLLGLAARGALRRRITSTSRRGGSRR